MNWDYADFITGAILGGACTSFSWACLLVLIKGRHEEALEDSLQRGKDLGYSRCLSEHVAFRGKTWSDDDLTRNRFSVKKGE